MPASPTVYVQPCPICSRPLQIPIRLLGKSAACYHCEATFVPRDLTDFGTFSRDPQPALIDRADALLATCDRHRLADLVKSTTQESKS